MLEVSRQAEESCNDLESAEKVSACVFCGKFQSEFHYLLIKKETERAMVNAQM